MHSEFAYFKFPCAVWLGILFGLLHVSLHRELSYLTKTRYMEVDSLPVEPACFLFFSLFFFLKLCLPLLLKQLGGGEKKPFGIHLCHIGSFIITNGKAILQKY